MKFMMMSFRTDADSLTRSIVNWPKEDVTRHIQFMMEVNRKLKGTGEFVDAQGLAWPNEAKVVRARKNGPPVTDGVFPETKEFLIGYWILELASAERAYEVAAEVSAAPGLGGEPLNMAIEVRQILSGPPL